MAKAKEYDTVAERLHWSYANLAMAHSAVEAGQARYKPLNYMIRARLYKGLMEGRMSIGSLMEDERLKILSGAQCSYCGSTENPTLDHIFPRFGGGLDTGDNLVFACRGCNSAKGKKDLLAWMAERGAFPPLGILRRYLKLAIGVAVARDLMPRLVAEVGAAAHPINLAQVPITYPAPDTLRWSWDPAA